jgi:8-amino-7-oxononanoate synthase
MTSELDLDSLNPEEKRALLKKLAQRKREERENIAPERYDLDAFPEILQVERQYEELDALGISDPTFLLHEAPSSTTTTVDGHEVINFIHYNYLGLARTEEVNRAAKDAIDRYGTTTGGSRLAAGEMQVHRELEAEIADFLGTEDAVVFLGGHAANESTIGHLLNPSDLLLHDELAHNSILQGGMLSGAELRSFPHLDAEAASEFLADNRHRFHRVMVAIEGSYSAEGTVPDLRPFVQLRDRHKVLLFVDEAHSFGVLGTHGRGLTEHCDVAPGDVDIIMGTLSKALGAAGGYIAGSRRLVDYLRRTAPGFVYSVGIAPPIAAAALAALRKLRAEPERIERLNARARHFLEVADELDLDTGPHCRGPMVPIYVESGEVCLAMADRLRRSTAIACPMVPPVVAPGTARLRFCVCADHTEEQIERTLQAVATQLSKLR